jgi:hypothetical protein
VNLEPLEANARCRPKFDLGRVLNNQRKDLRAVRRVSRGIVLIDAVTIGVGIGVVPGTASSASSIFAVDTALSEFTCSMKGSEHSNLPALVDADNETRPLRSRFFDNLDLLNLTLSFWARVF